VGPVTIVFGIILIALGVGGYLATMTSMTALIPAAIGLLLVLLGFLARNEKVRMHVMHGAVLVGLIGLAGGVWRIIVALLKEAPASTGNTVIEEEARRGIPVALGMNIAMAAICAVFVAFCVMSFINARRRRKQG
jgi:hypothetical protein